MALFRSCAGVALVLWIAAHTSADAATYGRPLSFTVSKRSLNLAAPPEQDPLVSLDVKNVTLHRSLKLLCEQVKVDYTLPPDLRRGKVSMKLRQPFRVALTTLLNASGFPLIYSQENNVISIIPTGDLSELLKLPLDENNKP